MLNDPCPRCGGRVRYVSGLPVCGKCGHRLGTQNPACYCGQVHSCPENPGRLPRAKRRNPLHLDGRPEYE